MRALRSRTMLVTASALALVATVAIGVLAAGGGLPRSPPPPSASGPSTSNGGHASSTTSPNPDPATTTSARPPISRIVKWIADQAPLGGGADGPEDEAFFALLEGDCGHVFAMATGNVEGDELRGGSVRTLYEGVGAACLAAFERQPQHWSRAEAALTRLAGQTSGLDCEQQTVYRLLEQLVSAHRTEPNATLVRRSGGKRGLLKCPRFLKITPDHGPATGGYPIRLEGENLPHDVGITFGDHHLTAVSDDGRHVVITAPPGKPGDSAWVFPDGWPFGYAFNPEFLYDRAGTTTSSSTTAPSTTTTQPSTTVPSSSSPAPSTS